MEASDSESIAIEIAQRFWRGRGVIELDPRLRLADDARIYFWISLRQGESQVLPLFLWMCTDKPFTQLRNSLRGNHF